jgi:hypothetical protein
MRRVKADLQPPIQLEKWGTVAMDPRTDLIIVLFKLAHKYTEHHYKLIGYGC